MKFLDLFWFFLDGNKSSQIIATKHQHKPQQQHHETEEASCNDDVEDTIDEQEFDKFFN